MENMENSDAELNDSGDSVKPVWITLNSTG